MSLEEAMDNFTRTRATYRSPNAPPLSTGSRSSEPDTVKVRHP